MPGTIQVSVLEFLPPQQSSFLSEISLNISMGKKEYQTFDKGDFSFPLISVRDNLIVILQNAEGKEIAHSVIETKLVIEKGIWDDLFPLEGGGHVHMKLQFILSEADRHRIRIMRESALKKKYDELLNSEVTSPKHSTMIRSYSASSLLTNQEVSDSHKSLLRNEVIQAILPSATTTFTLFKTQNSTKKETNPNDTDRYKDASSPSTVLRTIGVGLEEASDGRLVERTAINDPAETNFVEEASSLRSSGSVLARKLQADKQNLLEKSPSKIRNMISAFESSLNQDMRPKIRPASEKSELSENEVELSSGSIGVNGVDLKNTEVAQLAGRVKNPIHITKRQEKPKTSFVHPRDYSKESTTGLDRSKGTTVNLEDKAKYLHKVGIQEEKKSSEGFARALTGEKASVSRKMVHEKHKHNLLRRRVFGENLLKQTNKKEIQVNNLQDENCEGASADEPCSSECDGAWIFPDGGKRLCITAGGKEIMDIMGEVHLEGRRKPTKMSSEAENVKEVKEDDSKAPGRHEKSKTEDSASSRRPAGKMMRVGIMLGFATLVFFTRKRN
ncbi:uncharacterized protein [Euphorbia lathyris]|uniref:uncharacterized protein isoform X1 n=1 Tax=Euphorbia lathyris TaxID=212925 RepID=UPI0033135987